MNTKTKVILTLVVGGGLWLASRKVVAAAVAAGEIPTVIPVDPVTGQDLNGNQAVPLNPATGQPVTANFIANTVPVGNYGTVEITYPYVGGGVEPGNGAYPLYSALTLTAYPDPGFFTQTWQIKGRDAAGNTTWTTIASGTNTVSVTVSPYTALMVFFAEIPKHEGDDVYYDIHFAPGATGVVTVTKTATAPNGDIYTWYSDGTQTVKYASGAANAFEDVYLRSL